ncbi:integrator complex subunit 5 [Gallus gallus]|uniref:Integrator complex subunit 5 n=1 Tax=Gallus gallus TaxID=9031 RepID=A0A8V0X0V3_CHICK|nr:integrator complex subunit 5 [Gallus gallus]
MAALCDPPGSGSPPRAPLSPQDLSQELKAFLTGSDPTLGTPLSPPDHARCALRLLRRLPAARHAVLQHLAGLFDDHVCAHLRLRSEIPPNPPSNPLLLPPPAPSALTEVIHEAQRLLLAFIKAKPNAWAPLLASWAVELLGQLSSKYSGRHGARGLNELLQLWMSCEATRTLMDIYAQCLAALIASCPDACVDALLDTSVQHSPHFDWVVAHIGGSFPGTIISRVLSCGLKDFCAHGDAAAAAAGGGADKRVPKLASVVGILGHLASRHGASIKQELLRMFHEGLAPGQHKGTVPFLLQLALMSPPLLGTVAAELVESLKPSVLNQLHQRFSPLPRDELDSTVALLVRLICQTSAGAFRTLQFLLDTAMPASVITQPGLALHDGVREACDRLVALLLLQLQKSVHNRPSASLADGPQRCVPFLEALRGRVAELCAETLRLERKRYLWQHQLLGLLAVYAAPHGAPEALFHLLASAKGQDELALATQLHAVLAASLADLPGSTAALCVRQIHAGALAAPQLAQLLHNLALVVANEDVNEPASLGAQLAPALVLHLPELAQLLLHPSADAAEAAALLLCSLPAPRCLRPAQLHAALRAAVHHFFLALRRAGGAGLCHAARLLEKLSAVTPSAGRAALQLLVEGALRGGNAELFGGAAPGAEAEADGGTKSKPAASLLDTNRRFTAAVDFSAGVWSVFHAGVIGHGLKAPPGSPALGEEEVNRNTHAFLGVLLRCCRVAEPAPPPVPCIGPEAAKTVASALVDSVCPAAAAAAGGELCWPPEEQARSTVERDLGILRRFRQQPLLFPLLRVVAMGRPALCYCSVLLRGLLATLMAHWDACRDGETTASPWHLQASCALVACMAEGSLLPPVLGEVQELFPRLAPFEVRLLLLSVWEYLREHSPLPQRFSFQPHRGLFQRDFAREGDPGKYLVALHGVLHRNVDRLGLLAGRFRS